ncbi:MAG: hypothetical protein E7L00_05740 [Propionibacteriaceae bacterium]|nr:hypothetical protein [Propionibacteriaceae bacterium]
MRERGVKPLATAVLSIVLAMLLASLASPALAVDERIESLDVVYTIRPDGTVRVTTTSWTSSRTAISTPATCRGRCCLGLPIGGRSSAGSSPVKV